MKFYPAGGKYIFTINHLFGEEDIVLSWQYFRHPGRTSDHLKANWRDSKRCFKQSLFSNSRAKTEQSNFILSRHNLGHKTFYFKKIQKMKWSETVNLPCLLHQFFMLVQFQHFYVSQHHLE